MNPIESQIQRRLSSLSFPLAVVLPSGRRVGAADARLTLGFRDWAALAHLLKGQIGRLGEEYVKGRMTIAGTMRDMAALAVELIGGDPTQVRSTHAPMRWWRDVVWRHRSAQRHGSERDAAQVQFHYDVSDEFFALWLDPLRVYSCAYYREPGLDLAQAQQAKLDHICRKLMLRPGERLLDIGAGWGGLLLWAAEHYGVQATGITLSQHQHEHVERCIAERGLQGRVAVLRCDYRDLPEDQPFDKIASVGMFEHVGHARLPAYFAKLLRLLKPGGLLMNHGITAGGTHNHQLGAGLGDFTERYVFPGGELLHISQVLRVLSESRLEMLDVENLRPHYARTLWAWSDALEAQLDAARALVEESVLRAYRLYLPGSAMAFEQGWLSVHQVLAVRHDVNAGRGDLPGAQSGYPFNRQYMYGP